METLEQRLQKRIHVSLYALLFLTTLLGLSVLLEGCVNKREATKRVDTVEQINSGAVHLLINEPPNRIAVLQAFGSCNSALRA